MKVFCIFNEKKFDLIKNSVSLHHQTTAIIEVEGQSGTNFIPLGVIVEHIAIAPTHEQNQIKNTLVKIDFLNGDIMHFFTYLAKAIAR